MATTTPSAGASGATGASRPVASADSSPPAPPKPWERAGTSTSASVQPIAGRSALDNALGSSSGMTTNSSLGTTSAFNSMGASSALSGYGANTTGAYGSAYGSGVGSAYGNGLGSTYGGGYGSSIGGMGGYGGYGSSYGGGYGSSYGGGYGGYSGGIGGGYMRGGYGMMGGMNGAMEPNGNMGWLSSFSQMVSSIGQITDMLGMNAEALNFCIGSFVHFVERIGAMFAGIASMVSPRPQFPPGHPRHGEPALTEEEEKSRQRRVRILQFMLTMVAVTVMYKGARWLASLRRKQPALLTAKPAVPVSSRASRDLESIFRQTVGSTPASKPSFGMMK